MISTTPPRLMIVDDSRMSRMLIRALIAEVRPDWEIIEADNGSEAIRICAETQPDFVSMDVNMPGISGLEAAGRIRLQQPATRIALCTANIQESTREAASKAGLHFIPKPINARAIDDALAFFESST